MAPNNKGQCPPPPPSSPAHHAASSSSQQPQHHQPQQVPQQQEIANLLQYAQTSYQSNPTDALSSLLDALTLSTGTNTAAQHAMDRIRTELGHVVAESVSSRVNPRYATLQQHQHQLQQHQHNASSGGSTAMNEHLSEREMTLKAMAVVKELLNDSSTILFAQGRQHLLQQAMEDGSSVVCSNCGDMIARERMIQHAKYWCSAIVVEGEDEGKDDDDVAMDG